MSPKHSKKLCICVEGISVSLHHTVAKGKETAGDARQKSQVTASTWPLVDLTCLACRGSSICKEKSERRGRSSSSHDSVILLCSGVSHFMFFFVFSVGLCIIWKLYYSGNTVPYFQYWCQNGTFFPRHLTLRSINNLKRLRVINRDNIEKVII